VDFHRAIFATHFDGLRRGVFDQYLPDPDQAWVKPRFPAAKGRESARTLGFRVEVPGRDNQVHGLDFDLRFFSTPARLLRAEMIQKKDYPKDKKLLFQVSAYLDDTAPPERSSLFSLGPVSVQIPIYPGCRQDLGPSQAWDEPSPADPAVLISRSLLEETVEEAKRFPDREIGGFLLGKLYRDSTCGEILVHVTCLVSGVETTAADRQSITFTPETFARAREMIALRARDNQPEIITGWYHSHPFRLCQCPECQAATPDPDQILFFSLDDCHMMETTFPQPYMIGLLSAVEPRLEQTLGHLPVRLFGWRQGEIQQRGFEVIDS
jgi:proteasome lid subunit RPN8/RPN11